MRKVLIFSIIIMVFFISINSSNADVLIPWPPGDYVYFTLSWEPVDDPDVQEYRVYYRQHGQPMELKYSGSRTSIDFALPKNKLYYFTIQSVDIYGNADPMSEVLKWRATSSPTQGIYIERKVRKLWITY